MGFSFSFGLDGWVRFDNTDYPPTYLRYLPDDRGRWTLRELFMDGTETGLTAKMLQALPLSNIEATVNREAEEFAGLFGSQTVTGGYTTDYAPSVLAVLASYYNAHPGPKFWQRFVEGQIRRVPRRRPRAVDTDYVLDGPPPAEGLTDEFLRKVARAYAAAVARGEAPNAAIYAQVPQYANKRAVEWWVRKARERGIMPPGRRGARG